MPVFIPPIQLQRGGGFSLLFCSFSPIQTYYIPINILLYNTIKPDVIENQDERENIDKITWPHQKNQLV